MLACLGQGCSAKDAGELQVARQVEDNTTKAFINVLQLADPSVVSSWIEALGVTGIARDDFHADFFIQGGPTACAAAQRHLAVITAGDDAAAATWAESTADKGRIDAAIHVPGHLLIAIEAKVGAALDGGQLARHASDWGIPGLGEVGPAGIPGCLFTTWGAIYRWTRSLLERDDLPALSWFLLDQFADYLEIIGVTPFAGFRSEDFALLATRQQRVAGGVLPTSTPVLGDPALDALVKDRVSKLWDAILPRLTSAEQAALGEIHVGSLRANDYRMWAATNWGASGVNFTFELDPLQLELDLVAWKGGQVDLFDRWLKTPTAMRSLGAVGDLFELVVWRRRAIASKAGEPYWMHNTYEVIDRIPMPPPPDLIDRLAAHRDSCESGWERVAYHLRRSWPREAVLAAGEDLAEQAVHAMRAVIPLLHPINWPKPGPLPAERLVGIKPRITLADMGFELAAGSDGAPLEWQFVAAGPSLMVSSPSGMHPRGTRYHLAVWPGPARGQATYVACAITKSYASGGREGHIHLVSYGPDIRTAIRAINIDLRAWQTGEHYPPDDQPPDRAPLDEQQLIRSLQAGEIAFSGGWDGLDALARSTCARPRDVLARATPR